MGTKFIRTSILFLLILLLSSCTKGSTDDNGGFSGSTPVGESRRLVSVCGVVRGGGLDDNLSSEDAILVQEVIPVSSDMVFIVNDDQERLLVKLHGITGIGGTREDRGISLIESIASFSAFYVPADNNCTTTLPTGETGNYGQIFSFSGESVNEALLRDGLVTTAVGDPCGGELLQQCYENLEETLVPDTAGFDAGGFLWKPASERDGDLVVLVDNLFDQSATVFVNGEALIGSGPSNGYGYTARGNRPGGQYGVAEVSIRLPDGTIVPICGQESYTVQNTSRRFRKLC